jgi:hypothetical protein
MVGAPSVVRKAQSLTRVFQVGHESRRRRWRHLPLSRLHPPAAAHRCHTRPSIAVLRAGRPRRSDPQRRQRVEGTRASPTRHGAGDGKAAADAGRPVSMAKLTLEDQLGQLPARIDGPDRCPAGDPRQRHHHLAIVRPSPPRSTRCTPTRWPRPPKPTASARWPSPAARQAEHEADAAEAGAQAAVEESVQAAEAAREQLRAAEARVVEVENARARRARSRQRWPPSPTATPKPARAPPSATCAPRNSPALNGLHVVPSGAVPRCLTAALKTR